MQRSFLPRAIDFLRRRKKAYVAIFQPGTALHDALVDLARFSRAFGNEVVIGDHDSTLILAGRREMFWRIYSHIHLEPDELAVLYKAAILPDQGDE